MKNLILNLLMLGLTALTLTISACHKKNHDNAQAVPKKLMPLQEIAVVSPKLNESKEIVLETRKDTNFKESLFSVNEELLSKNEGLFFIGRRNDPGQAVTFAPQVYVIYPERNKAKFRKIDDPSKFDDFQLNDIKDVPAAAKSDTAWKEGNVYLGEFSTKFYANKRAHKTLVLIRVDAWDNNAEKVKLSYKFLSFGPE